MNADDLAKMFNKLAASGDAAAAARIKEIHGVDKITKKFLLQDEEIASAFVPGGSKLSKAGKGFMKESIADAFTPLEQKLPKKVQQHIINKATIGDLFKRAQKMIQKESAGLDVLA